MTQQKDDKLKDYVTVAERVSQFYAKYPQGRINTSIIQHDIDVGFILIRAEVFRTPDDALPAATGHAYEYRGEGYVNKNSYIENCETGAVGRAIAFLGFGVKLHIASREEMQKAERMQAARRSTLPPKTPSLESLPPAEQHKELDHMIIVVCDDLGHDSEWLTKTINKRFETDDGLNSLGIEDKKKVLEGLLQKREQAETTPA